MTRDEVLALKPGRELDARVAEKVMGYTTHGQFLEKNGVRVMIDRYSTDIAAAFEVWEHDRPKKWNFDLCYSDGTYLAEIYKPDDVIGVRILAQVESKSAAEAMVKCRLLALEGGEGE